MERLGRQLPDRRRVLLNYPPASSVWHLPMGIAQLTGVLKADGHEVEQQYGHIEGLEHVLAQYGGESIRNAIDIVKNGASNIHDRYSARKTFESVSGSIPTQDRFSVERNNILFVSEHYDGSIEGVLEAVRNREQHLWYEYFKDVEVSRVLSFKPHLYGISVADERQFIQACILASMVKDASPETMVVMGGNFWSRVTAAFQDPQFVKFFDFCDAIVYREGFQPMRELAETLDPSRVSGTVWRGEEGVEINPPTHTPTDFESLPTPVFANTQQWSPDKVYPLYTMSNCPMQCGFCAISAGSDSFLTKPRSMSPQKIAAHMAAVRGPRFDIVDEMFSIQRQLELGEELKRIGHSATWNCYMTVNDQLLDPQISHRLYEAGCRSVQLGLETLSPQTLQQENKKWNHPRNYGTILKNLADVGIQNHVFIISGIPGEPLHWNLKWLDFMEQHGDSILTIKSGRYRLTRNSPEDRFGRHSERIKLLPDNKPLHLNKDFSYTGTSMKRVLAMRDLHDQMSREHWAYQVTSTLPWWANRGRFSLEELRQMARELEMYPKENPVPHLRRDLVKMSAIVREELGISVDLRSYQSAVELAKTLD